MERDEAGLVARAVDGDKAALEEMIRLLQDPLYRLALRMVWRPADAEDATQEILIRVVTRLASWRGEAKLLTWAYRIGVNYLLNLRRQTPQEAQQVSLDEFGDTLADGLADADYRGPEAAVLVHEVRLSCTQAMLQCLERGDPRRPAFTAHPVSPSGRSVVEAAAQLHRLHGAAAVMRAHPDYAAPQAKVDAITALLHSGRFPLLE
jgi:RNA polymerase sigma factor (sigma-70 family)